MAQTLAQKYPELLHYTTAQGLQGILESGYFRATHYGYLNDNSEFKDFFKIRLPDLLDKCIGPAITIFYGASAANRQYIIDNGGLEDFIANQKTIFRGAIQEAIHGAYEPYLISFCGVKDSNDARSKDGLLSQWRGYGTDGGYAIVFDTVAIASLLETEKKQFYYSFKQLGEADYYEHHNKAPSILPEMVEFEEGLKSAITNQITNPSSEALAQMLVNAISLAAYHKHIGFKEEAEVRLVVVPAEKEHAEEMEEIEGRKELKSAIFYSRNGLLVPSLALFNKQKLPILKVIVGPHPDYLKRVKSVEKLLETNGYDLNKTKVTYSEIPYIGK